MHNCAKCGQPVWRVRRSIWQRIRYAAIYKCRACQAEERTPRAYQHHFGPYVRCPRCGTVKVSRLQHRDKIDRMHWGLLPLIELIVSGGQLFHCRFCRRQFYDRRELSPNAGAGA